MTTHSFHRRDRSLTSLFCNFLVVALNRSDTLGRMAWSDEEKSYIVFVAGHACFAARFQVKAPLIGPPRIAKQLNLTSRSAGGFALGRGKKSTGQVSARSRAQPPRYVASGRVGERTLALRSAEAHRSQGCKVIEATDQPLSITFVAWTIKDEFNRPRDASLSTRAIGLSSSGTKAKRGWLRRKVCSVRSRTTGRSW